MARIRTASTTAMILRQTAISVTATLIATAVVGEIRSQFAMSRPDQIGSPLLTSGGKFAARAEVPAVEESDPVLLSAALPPLLMASADRDPTPTVVPAVAVSPMPASAGPVVVAQPKAVKSVHADARRHMASAGSGVMPPRRADFVAAEPLSPVPTATAGLAGVWSTARGMVSEATGLGGVVWDKISPMQFVP